MSAPTLPGVVQMLFAAVVTMTFAVKANPPAVAIPDDRVRSVGRWEVAAVEMDGRPVDPEVVTMLTVAFRPDGSWTVLFKSLPVAEGTSRNDQDANPKTFDMETLGSEAIEPTKYRGIYRFEGDSRVLCFVPDGEPRPDAFIAPPRSHRILVTLKRPRPP